MGTRIFIAAAASATLALAACNGNLGESRRTETADARSAQRDRDAGETAGVTVVRANLQGAQIEFGGVQAELGRNDADLKGRAIEAAERR